MNRKKKLNVIVLNFDKFDKDIKNVAKNAIPNFQVMFDCMQRIDRKNDSYSERFASIWNGLIDSEETVQKIYFTTDVSEDEVAELARNLIDAIFYLQDNGFGTCIFIDTFRSLNGKVFECKDYFPVLS
ncbi:MAG TPA: hypothetical protein OIM20_07765 [Eggerthellaceae bacterium]|nr:hypothetical protein [Eggerthellaceae bacterium]